MSASPSRTFRSLLLVVVILIAGCSSAGPSQADPTTIDSATPRAESTTTSTEVRTLFPGNRADTLTIGNESTLPSGVRAHHYSIINFQNDTSLTLSLTVRRNGSDILQHTETLPATTTLRIDVYRIGNYTVTIESDDVPDRTFEVPLTFDCNTHSFNVMYRGTGEWSTGTVQTALKC